MLAPPATHYSLLAIVWRSILSAVRICIASGMSPGRTSWWLAYLSFTAHPGLLHEVMTFTSSRMVSRRSIIFLAPLSVSLA